MQKETINLDAPQKLVTNALKLIITGTRFDGSRPSLMNPCQKVNN